LRSKTTTDNFAWSDVFGTRFGLIRADYATLKRTPKLSAPFFRAAVAENQVARDSTASRRAARRRTDSPASYGRSKRADLAFRAMLAGSCLAHPAVHAVSTDSWRRAAKPQIMRLSPSALSACPGSRPAFLDRHCPPLPARHRLIRFPPRATRGGRPVAKLR
jgi:hypothetical protein